MTTNIYVLRDPRNNQIRYVGKANDPEYSYKNHINKCRDKNTHKRNWINELKKEKLKPILEIIDIVPVDRWKEFEKFYIKKYIDEGCKLVNYTNGGDGCTFGNQTSFKPGNGARKVIMLDKEGNYIKSFNMIIEAEKYMKEIKNINTNGVAQVLVKRNKTCGGFIFIYEEEYKKMTKEDIDKIVSESIYIPKPNKGSFKKGDIPLKRIKKTYQYDVDGNFMKEWNSVSEAQRYYNLHGGIMNCVNGKNKTAGGYKWSYVKK
jgi:hypothetical protein